MFFQLIHHQLIVQFHPEYYLVISYDKFKFKNSYTFEDTSDKVVIINEEIKTINYANNSINVITNKNYYKYSLDLENNTKETATNKIKSENNTNKLEDIQDFVIDENFEIGYLAFQERLKWFYF